MTRLLLLAIAFLAVADAALFLLYLWQKSKAKSYGDLYDGARRRNEDLAAQLGKYEAAEIIRQEERKNAERKIGDARRGTARERFDAINGGLRDGAG